LHSGVAVFTFRCAQAKAGPDWARISDALPFGRLWYDGPNAITNAIGYGKFYSRSHDALIHVYDEGGDVIAMHEQAGEFKSGERSARETKSRHAVKSDG
jgi:hypothetical protein